MLQYIVRRLHFSDLYSPGKKLQFSNDNGVPFRHVRIPSKITIGGSRGARPIKIFPLFIQFWKIDK